LLLLLLLLLLLRVRMCVFRLTMPLPLRSLTLLPPFLPPSLPNTRRPRLSRRIPRCVSLAVYENHVEALEEQLQRTPRPFPKLRIVGAEQVREIDELRMEHLKLEGYEPHAKIAMKMAV
jgi:hypothetical protein